MDLSRERRRRLRGQVAIVDAARANAAQVLADLPLVQRPVLHSALLLDHAMRLPDWQVHDSLPVLDEAERFVGVLRSVISSEPCG